MRLHKITVVLTLLICGFSAAPIGAADKADFSGAYTLTGSKGAFQAKGVSGNIRVVQTESSLEIVKTIDGKETRNTFHLDGSEGVVTTSGGQKGVGKAQFKGKMLVFDTIVTSRPQLNAPEVQIHTRERWELSSDSQTLTVRSDVDFPNSGLGELQIVEPWSEIYKRN